jgi:hypothetical protein
VIVLFSRTKQGERRLSPAFYRLSLAAHIVVSVGWLGVVCAKITLKLIAITTSAPGAANALAAASERLNVAFPPLAIGTVVTGVLLSLGTKWGLLQHYWVVTKIALTVGVIATAVQIGSRIPQTSAAAVDGGTILGIASSLSSPAILLLSLSVTHLLMLGMATVLSVYKPWGKTWLGRRKSAARPAQAHQAQAHQGQPGLPRAERVLEGWS